MNRLSRVVLIFLISYSTAICQTEASDTVLHASKIEDIKFTSSYFRITGSLYTPINSNSNLPVLIWVSGSGPSFRKIKSKETIKVVNCVLDNGFAYFRIDKPGVGDSEGKVNDDSVFEQLSDIVVDAVKTLKKLSGIDTIKIGLFGSSQAGYIMPLAASKCNDISFIIGSSCPGENSIDQWNYLIEKQMECEGYSKEKAKLTADMFKLVRTTTDKARFDEAISYLGKNPMIIKSVNYDSGFVNKLKEWWPREIDLNDESHFNPISIIEKLKIPIYLIYGKNDTQINPIQAIEAYKNAFKKSGNQKYDIEFLDNTDHNMCKTKTGCLSEINEMNNSNRYFLNPLYLVELKRHLLMLLN